MRINQIHHVEINHRTLSVNCDHCRGAHLLERLSVHGFIVHATRLAKQHRHCGPQSTRAAREDAEARELAALMESEAEFTQQDLERRTGKVIPFSGRSNRRGKANDGDPLCLLCGTARTYSVIGICGGCQQTHGATTCLRMVKERAIVAEMNSLAAGAGGVN
jgi:hypothetical protein